MSKSKPISKKAPSQARSKAAVAKTKRSAGAGPKPGAAKGKTKVKQSTGKAVAKKPVKASAKARNPVTKKASPAKKSVPISRKAAPAKKATTPSSKKKPAARKAVPAAKGKTVSGKKALPAHKPKAQVKATKKVQTAVKVSKPLPSTRTKAISKPAKPAPVAKAVAPAPKAVPAKKAGPGKTAAVTPVIEVTEPQQQQPEQLAQEPPVAPKAVVRPPVAAAAPGPSKFGALVYDCHMHTPLCKHAWGEPEEYAEQAIKAGLKGIVFTCHCPMPDGYWPTVRMAMEEFDAYVDMVQRAAKAYRGKIDVLLGMESEFFPGCESWIRELHQRAPFHFVLGSVHWQAKEYLAKFETGTIEGFRRTYFNHLADSAESGLYDCLGHPDLVKNYHPDSWCFAILKDQVVKSLDRIAATGVAMELNTSGLNKSYSEMNPGKEMLAMLAARKIPIVLGSDAHRPVRVGEHFVTALNVLKEVGYDKVSHFINRQRVDLKIDDALASIHKAAAAAES